MHIVERMLEYCSSDFPAMLGFFSIEYPKSLVCGLFFPPNEREFTLRYQTAGMLETVLRQGVMGEDDTGE